VGGKAVRLCDSLADSYLATTQKFVLRLLRVKLVSLCERLAVTLIFFRLQSRSTFSTELKACSGSL
jgi:hypothetical protein